MNRDISIMALATSTVESTEYNVEHSEVVKTLDIAIAQEFINTLTGSTDTRMNFRTFAETKGAKAKGIPAKTPKGSLTSYATELQRLNNEGSGVFFTVQQAKGDKAEDVTAIRALFVDFDGHLPTESEWHLQPSIIVCNADNKGHAYWVLSEHVAMSGEELTQLQKRLVAHYHLGFLSDFAATDIARVMRLPGSWHLKKEPTLVTNTYIGSERYSVDEMMTNISNDMEWVKGIEAEGKARKAALEGKAKGTNTSKSKPSATPSLPSGKNKDFDRMLAAAVAKVAKCTEGGRNSTLNTEARTLAGLFPDKVGIIRSGLSEAAITCGLLLAEIGSTLDSAIKAGILKPITAYGSSGSGKKDILALDADIANSGLTVRLNQMSGKVEVNGEPLDLDMLRRFTSHQFGYKLSTEDLIQCWVGAGYENPYHPVVEYLRGLPATTLTIDLSTLALEFFGDPSPLAAVMVKRKLIAAVARVMQPGCKDDHLLVLMGAQGYRKTSFIEALASMPWFTNDLTDISSKDDVQLLKEKWLIEMGEVDGVMSKKEDSDLKAFLSKKEDIYRQVYKRENKAAKRSSSLWASTNKTDILQDPTGSRRYWVVQVNQRIDITQVEAMRDSIWFSALAAYDAGEIWYLTDAEEAEQKEVNKQFADVDPWFDTIKSMDICDKQGGGYITSYSRVYEKLDIKAPQQTKMTQRRIAGVMTQLGYEFKHVKVNGKSLRHWWIGEKP